MTTTIENIKSRFLEGGGGGVNGRWEKGGSVHANLKSSGFLIGLFTQKSLLFVIRALLENNFHSLLSFIVTTNHSQSLLVFGVDPLGLGFIGQKTT